MGDQRPAPLVPPEVDLRSFDFMPLLMTLLTSDFALESTGDEFKAGVLLWQQSWHQIPAASLPNSDRALARLSMADDWPAVKAVALRHWVECSDGRLYHPLIAQLALDSWHRKRIDSSRTRLATRASLAKRRADAQRDVERDVERDAGVTSTTRARGQG